MQTYVRYKRQGAEVKQTTFGNFLLLECNNYLIREFGLYKYYIFDAYKQLVCSIPYNVNLELLSAEPSRLIIHYVELPVDYKYGTRFKISQNRVHNRDGALYNNGADMLRDNRHIDILICERVGYEWTGRIIKATKTFSRK